MTIPLVINGTTYNYPVENDSSWGAAATNWAAAVTNGMLTKAGGTFTLTTEVNFGGTAGIKVLSIKSQGAPVASGGVLRLADGEQIAWRNHTDSGNNTISFTAGNAFAVNGVALTGVGTVTSVDVTAPAAGITASGGPITGSGSITLALANDLAAVEALATTGLAVRTGVSTWTTRTLTGTAARVTVTNGDGIAGAPTVDIDATYVGQASITTLGTVATGTWNATTIGVAKGGTNITSYTKGDLLAASAGTTLNKVAVGTDGQLLIADSAQTAGVAWASGSIGKNAIINGDMNIWQRGTNFAPISSGTYGADRWMWVAGGVGVVTMSRNTDVPSVAQAGRLYNYSLDIQVNTIDAAIAAGDIYYVNQRIEGYNWLPLAQRVTTVSFWIKAKKIGIYCAALGNATDRSIPIEFTISVADTWEKKTITVLASPSAGTWNYTTGIGCFLTITLAGGSTYQSTNNVWSTGVFTCTANQVNGMDSVANYVRVTGVQLEVGSVATEFENVAYAVQLLRCERYFLRKTATGGSNQLGVNGYGYSTNVQQNYHDKFNVEMRADPTFSRSADADFYVLSNGGTATAASFSAAKTDKWGAFLLTANTVTVNVPCSITSQVANAWMQYDCEL